MPFTPKILVAESRDFSPRAAESIKSVARVVFDDCSYRELLAAVPDADVLWVRLRHFIGRDVFRTAPRLKIVVSSTTGLNHIDQEEAARGDIQILSLRDDTEFLRNVRATSEHTIALMLALLRKLPTACKRSLDGAADRDDLRGGEIFGKTVGLVGYGRLGRLVADYLSAFGAKVLVTDPHPVEFPPNDSLQFVSLGSLLAESDIVSLHASLRSDNTGFFDRASFNAMKAGSIFVNTARGELIDEDALLEALETGHLGAAALDVLANETSLVAADHPLIRYARQNENLLITPHIGGSTVESLAKVEERLAQRLVDRFRLASPSAASPLGPSAVVPVQ